MPSEENEPSPYSNHYPTLADYSCARDGDHVFFFRDRQIFYGGQIVGSDEHDAFYLNGQRSQMERAADAPLVCDESGNRKRMRLHVSVPSESGSSFLRQLCYVGCNRVEIDGVNNRVFGGDVVVSNIEIVNRLV